MEVTATHQRSLTVALAVAAVILLSACRDEDPTLPAASSQDVHAEPNAPDWLEASEDETPLAFLARVTQIPPGLIAASLERATAAYDDSPRMIANRTAQLWQEIRQKDDPPMPIHALLDQLAMRQNGLDRSIGPVIQHYRVLRAQGHPHDAAMQGSIASGKER